MAFFGKAQQMIEDVMTKEPPAEPAVSKLVKPLPAQPVDVMDDAEMAEYAEVAQAIGLESVSLAIEAFRAFLVKRDMPVFSITEVTRYMDELTARDNPSQFGWHWCPVRAKDKESPMQFGTPAVHDKSGLAGSVVNLGGGGGGLLSGSLDAANSISALQLGQMQRDALQNQMRLNAAFIAGALGQPSSYQGATVKKAGSDFYSSTGVALYRRAIPLHALRKIALIEKEFTGPIRPVFLVSEYTTEPHVVITPDPFLMAVLPNDLVAQGVGRFIIDVWDEPGFGIRQMVK